MSAYAPELGLGQSLQSEIQGANPWAKTALTVSLLGVAAATAYLESLGPMVAWPKTETSVKGSGNILGLAGLGQSNADFVRDVYEPLLGPIGSMEYSTRGITPKKVGRVIAKFASENLDLNDPDARLHAITHSMGLPTLITGLLAAQEEQLLVPKLGTVLCLGSPLFMDHAVDAVPASRIARSHYPGGILTKGIGEIRGVFEARNRARRWAERGRTIACPPVVTGLKDAWYNAWHGTSVRLWTSQVQLLHSAQSNILKAQHTGSLQRIIDGGTTVVDFSDPDWDEVVRNRNARNDEVAILGKIGAHCLSVDTEGVDHANAIEMLPFVTSFLRENADLRP